MGMLLGNFANHAAFTAETVLAGTYVRNSPLSVAQNTADAGGHPDESTSSVLVPPGNTKSPMPFGGRRSKIVAIRTSLTDAISVTITFMRAVIR